MKTLWIVILLFGFNCTLAQNQKSDEKARKQEEKARKQEEKTAENQRRDLLKSMTVNMKDLELFPHTYIGRTVRAERILLGELKKYSEGDQNAYFIDVDVPRVTSFYNFPAPDSEQKKWGQAFDSSILV